MFRSYDHLQAEFRLNPWTWPSTRNRMQTTNFKIIISQPYLWSRLQIQKSGFNSRQTRSPLSLASTTEELLERNSSGCGLENRDYGRRDPSRWPRGTIYPQNLALPSPTNGGRSVGIVLLRTQAKEFSGNVQFGVVLCVICVFRILCLIHRIETHLQFN
jgi:hypothetical protein